MKRQRSIEVARVVCGDLRIESGQKVKVEAEALVKPRARFIPCNFFVLASFTFFVGDRGPLTLSEMYVEVFMSGRKNGRSWMVFV